MPFIHDRHQILKVVKQELGSSGRDLTFNAYSDERSVFEYESTHALGNFKSIGTSTTLAA